MIAMEQYILNWLFAAAGALSGWLVKILWDAVSNLKNDLGNLERNLPHVYVRRDDFRDATQQIRNEMQQGFSRIENTLNVLFKRLDTKEDK